MAYIYEEILNYLRFLIEQNSDDQFFKLPTESQLCLKYGASRITVRKALSALKEEGKITSRQGKGYFISDKLKPFKNTYKRKPTIAAIMTSVANKHHRNILNGINKFSYENNINLITFFSYNDPIKEQNKLIDAMNEHCDGVILFPSDNDIYSSEIFKLKINGIPTVLVDRNLLGLDLPCISSNHFEITYKSIQLFHRKMVKKIVYISHQKDLSSSTKDRAKGVEQGLLDFMGQINKDNFIYDSFDEFDDEQKIKFYYEYLKGHPDTDGVIYTASQAIFCFLEAMKKAGREPKKDLSIILIDDELENIPSITNMKFPTIKQDGVSIGYQAASLVFDLIRKLPKEKLNTIFIPTFYNNWT